MSKKSKTLMLTITGVILIAVIAVIVIKALGNKDAVPTQTPAQQEISATDAPILTEAPTSTPTAEPTATPTAEPTAEPTATPTPEPTATPTAEPTATPSPEPTATPEPTISPEDQAFIDQMMKEQAEREQRAHQQQSGGLYGSNVQHDPETGFVIQDGDVTDLIVPDGVGVE